MDLGPVLIIVSVVCASAVAVTAILVRRGPAAPLEAAAPPVDIEAVTARLSAELSARLGREHADALQAAVGNIVAVADRQLAARADTVATEADLRSQAIDRQLGAVAGEIQRVGEAVAALQRERAVQHGEIKAGLDQAIRTTTALAGTTDALRQALASPKARGQWGERMADDVLRAAGLVEGVSYRKQTAIAGGTIPDFTFLLPEGRLLHMDVKFPIDNYVRHLEAVSEADAAAARAQFLRDVRSRVKELAGRGYADPQTTPGYLLLFIPNESVFSFVQEHDGDLLDVALQQRVLLCSPFTLFAVLGVIRQAVDSVRLERAGDEILDALARFQDQWAKMGDCLDRLGKQLSAAHNTYDDIAGPRRRQLERKLDEIEAIRTQRGLATPGDDEPAPRLRDVSSM